MQRSARAQPVQLTEPTTDAARLQHLSPDEGLIYNVIHSTGRTGIWVRQIQNRTGVHKSILDRSLKSLEGKNYIKSVHNVKFPSRKTYMLAGLAPSEDVTGGAWFTDGVLDANFISIVAGFIEYTASRKSWFLVPSEGGGNKRLKSGAGAAVKKEGGGGEKEYLAFPAGYQGYATVPQLTAAVNDSGITPVRLGEESITQLCQMLCYDNKLIALGDGKRRDGESDVAFYKATKTPEEVKAIQSQKASEEAQATVKHDLVKNGMTEAPCGQCPVFKLCVPGGAVSPESCEYFDPWLETALGF